MTVSFSGPQSAGDLNVVVVGWGDASSQVSSVSDSKGNLYSLAACPTALTGSSALTQSIYYAKNIVAASAGANVVTLTFNAAVASPRRCSQGITPIRYLLRCFEASRSILEGTPEEIASTQREALGTGQMFGTSRSVCSAAGNAHFAQGALQDVLVVPQSVGWQGKGGNWLCFAASRSSGKSWP